MYMIEYYFYIPFYIQNCLIVKLHKKISILSHRLLLHILLTILKEPLEQFIVKSLKNFNNLQHNFIKDY